MTTLRRSATDGGLLVLLIINYLQGTCLQRGDYTTHSSENRREQTGEAGGRLQDSRGEEPLESETWLRKCASVFGRLSVIIPVLHTSEIK